MAKWKKFDSKRKDKYYTINGKLIKAKNKKQAKKLYDEYKKKEYEPTESEKKYYPSLDTEHYGGA